MTGLPPSGDQHEIASAGYRAVVTGSGGALRLLEHEGRPLVDGFAEDAMSSGGRGQLLVPWTNRLRDGRYRFGGRTHQLALSEPDRDNASHGLGRWATWGPAGRTGSSVTLRLRLAAQKGYPWTLDLTVRYAVSGDGLAVTQSVHNRSSEPAPYACGAHPYLSAGAGPVDGWELTLPATRRLVVDDRLLPVGSRDIRDTEHDFRTPRPIGATSFDHAFGGLLRRDGLVTVTVRDPGTGAGTQLWGDRTVRWLQVFSADDVPGVARRSLAVEPMSAPADAFNSGTDLVTLAPDGSDGCRHELRWGIRAC